MTIREVEVQFENLIGVQTLPSLSCEEAEFDRVLAFAVGFVPKIVRFKTYCEDRSIEFGYSAHVGRHNYLLRDP